MITTGYPHFRKCPKRFYRHELLVALPPLLICSNNKKIIGFITSYVIPGHCSSIWSTLTTNFLAIGVFHQNNTWPIHEVQTKWRPWLKFLQSASHCWRVLCWICWSPEICTGWWLGHPSEKYESQLRWLFPLYGKIKNVPNHQPVQNMTFRLSKMLVATIPRSSTQQLHQPPWMTNVNPGLITP